MQDASTKCPTGLRDAVAAAARQHHTAPGEYVRQSLLRAIAADGVRLTPDGRIEGRAAAAGGGDHLR
jgi:hypothetical protein